MAGNREEAGRWFRQAEHDLEAAAISLSGGSYAWACFQSQQAAEKAVKSLLYGAGYRKILSHSVYELLLEARKTEGRLPLPEQEAKQLDSVYVTSRYPNGLAGGMTPSEYYTREDAERCIRSAGLILDAVRRFIPK